MPSALKVIKGVMKLLNVHTYICTYIVIHTYIHTYVHILSLYTQYALLVYCIANDFAEYPLSSPLVDWQLVYLVSTGSMPKLMHHL